MAKQNNERAFQNYVKDTIRSEGGWFSQLHPGMSSDFGIPDLLTAVDSVGILPTELKIGSIEDNVTLWSSSIRPSQIAWHTRLTEHGYPSSILIGVPSGKSWRIFIVEGCLAANVKKGLKIGSEAREIDSRFFLSEIDEWANDIYNYENDF